MAATIVEVALRTLQHAVVVRCRALRHHQVEAHHRVQAIVLVRAHQAAAHQRAQAIVLVRRAAAVVRHHRAIVVARVLRAAAVVHLVWCHALARQVVADNTL